MLNWKEKIIFKHYMLLDIVFTNITVLSIVEIFFIQSLDFKLLEMIGFITVYIMINLFILNGFNVYRTLVRKHGIISFKELLLTVCLLSSSTFFTSLLLWKLNVILEIEFYIGFNGAAVLAILLSRVIIVIFNKIPSSLSLENILIVGYSEEGTKYIDEIIKRKYLDVNLIGYLSEKKRVEYSKIPYLGTLSEFKTVVKSNVVDEITITSFYSAKSIVSETINYCKRVGITINLLIGNEDKSTRFKTHAEMIGDIATVKIHLVSFNDYQIFIKRIIDVAIGTVGFLMFSVLYVVLGIVIKLDSKGPVLFTQNRIGKHGRIFKIYKFRTMVINAEDTKKDLIKNNKMNGPVFKMKNDPRITRVGKILRKTSLDEFPQFINVLKGDMSIVGTRPPTVEEVKKYTKNEYQRIAIVPGITGVWQISGRSRITDFNEILKLETEYINKWNIYLDLAIILKTIKVVILCDGAE